MDTPPHFSRPKLWHLGASFALAAGLALVLVAGDTEPIDSYAACAKAGYPILDSTPPVCRAGMRNFTGTPTPSPAAAPVVTMVPFEILVDGDTKNPIPDHSQTFISNQSDWSAYWRQVHAGLSTLPPILSVDFKTSDVIGLSLASKTTGGYGLKVTGIATGHTGSVVDITESTPTITCTVTESISNRYLIIRTDGKLAEPVSFRITPENHRC